MQAHEWTFGRAVVATYMQSGRASRRWVEAEGGWNSGSVMWQGSDPTEGHRVVALVVAEQGLERARVPTRLLTGLWGVSEVDHGFSPH
jgi:hypothetical protein